MKRKQGSAANANSNQKRDLKNPKKIEIDTEPERVHYKRHHDRWRLEKSQIGRRNFP